MFVFDAASVHMLSMTTNEKATRAERICTARAEQMQIENYSCIVINSYSCDRAGLMNSIAMRWFLNQICTNSWSNNQVRP